MSYRGSALWVSTLGVSLDDGSTGETRYEEDLPVCCRDAAARIGAEEGPEYFECAVCGAAWQRPLPVEPEFDSFTYREPEEREGAA